MGTNAGFSRYPVLVSSPARHSQEKLPLSKTFPPAFKLRGRGVF